MAEQAKLNGERVMLHGEVCVTDGYSYWPCCPSARCDLQVVRPGKVQCNGRYNKLDVCPDYVASQQEPQP